MEGEVNIIWGGVLRQEEGARLLAGDAASFCS